MYKLLNWYKQYRLDLIKAKSEAKNAQFNAMVKMVEVQMQTIQQWFTGFSSYEVPKSTVVRDIDEYTAEQDRLHPALKQSIDNAIKAGQFPELQDILNNS